MIDRYDEAGIPAEIEADGFITRVETLERINASKAKPMTKCIYPKCEECDKYHGHYCTVPMVISKQDYIIINDKILDLMKRVLDLENLFTDEILRSKREEPQDPESELNYTWDDYFRDAK